MANRDHYITQSEQKQNAISETYPYVYKFEICNRSKFELKLCKNPVAISQTLMGVGLYAPYYEKQNIDQNFQKYELDYGKYVKRFLDNKDDLHALKHIFKLKMLNLFRNPQNYHDFRELWDSIWNMPNRKYEKGACHPYFLVDKKPKIGPDQHEKLHNGLDYLLTSYVENRNYFDDLTDEMFDCSVQMALLFRYDHYSPIYGDKGTALTANDTAINRLVGHTFTFNLNKNNLICFMLTLPENRILPCGYVDTIIHENKLEVLKGYNRRVIEQAHEFVFNSSDQVYGAIIDD